MTCPNLAALAHEVAHLGNGPQAELRRLDPRRADTWPAAFWKLFTRHIETAGPTSPDEDQQRSWAAVLAGMALLDQAQIHPGIALAENQYSELRFNRLLSADGPRRINEFRAAVRFLAAKRQSGIDWTQFALLLIHPPESPDGDRTRRHLAGAYYRTLAQKD